ncbi:hypothetical protein [Paucibacter sp. DJ2R-2]|uniref:hypothetical protein n=1 Tax=Paucibacter sp. DJ2R-2 TaxID=2893558 RepID=UPI0021E3E4CD|nr:hypothetical protein [Paucibacter sp. DJ2R-2]MCV2423440.1 hypothetical protein [Paucibacter sp. DJ4R-1]MCV2441317.1 hypothetical protein [Paucibacter sp. DJ2R-2]
MPWPEAMLRLLWALLWFAPGLSHAFMGSEHPDMPSEAAVGVESTGDRGALLWLRAMQLRPEPEGGAAPRQHLLNAQLRLHAQHGAGSPAEPRWTLHLDAEHWQARQREDWAWLRPAEDVRALGSPRARLSPQRASRLQLDWAYLSARQAGWQYSLGRQPISRGLGRLWSVLDLHAPFQPLDLERLYKPGVDALLFDQELSPGWTSQSLLSVRRETAPGASADLAPAPEGRLRWHVQQGLAWSRASDLGQLWLARRSGLTLLGLGAQRLDLAGGDWYVELLGHRDSSQPAPRWQHRALLGAQYRLRPGWMLNLEALRQSAPATPGLPQLGRSRHYLAGALSWEAHPLLQLDLLSLNNRSDASGQLLLGLKWQLREAMELRAHWSLPVSGERGSEFRTLGRALQLSLLMHH